MDLDGQSRLTLKIIFKMIKQHCFDVPFIKKKLKNQKVENQVSRRIDNFGF
jgi:hypothetical protein